MDSLEKDWNRYGEIDRETWKQLANDREKMKITAEEIYKETLSKISDGESSEEDNSRPKKYNHWKRYLRE